MSKKKYVYRWWDGPTRRKRTFDRKGDRDTFASEARRRRQLGGIVPIGKPVTLSEFVEVYWELHAVPNLEKQTRGTYLQQWTKYIHPRLGGYDLRELNPELLARFRTDLTKQGAGDATVRQVLYVLQSILTLAVAQGRLDSNPAAKIRKPSKPSGRQLEPVPPATVERLRGLLDVRDATIVSVLAYAGLRPQELLALHVEDLDAGHLWVHRKVVDGELLDYTKTRRNRRVPLLAPLAQDLAAYRLATGVRDGLLFPHDGGPWAKRRYESWRTIVYQPAARQVGLVRPVPYDLRASFVSLMLWEGRTMLEVAAMAGHSVMVCETHYARVFAGYDPAKRTSAAEAIAAARAELEATG